MNIRNGGKGKVMEEPTKTDEWETALRSHIAEDGHRNAQWWFWAYKLRKWFGPCATQNVAILRANRRPGGS